MHRWSVVVRGTAHPLTTDSEIEASGITLLISWSPTQKEHFVRVDPLSVSGRRFPKRFEAEPIAPPTTTGGVQTTGVRELSAQDGVLPKPWPIPHRPPLPPTRR